MGLEYQDGSILYIKEEIFVNCLKQNALPDDDFNEKNSGEHDCIVGHDVDRSAQHPPLLPTQDCITFQSGTASKRSFYAPEDSVTETRLPEQRMREPSAPSRWYTDVQYYRTEGRKMISCNPYMSRCQPSIASSPAVVPIDELAGREIGSVFAWDKSLWVKTKETEAKKITNFVVKLTGKIVKIGLHEEQEEFYNIRLESDSHSTDYMIECSDYLELQSKIEKNIRLMYVDSTTVQKASQFFKIYLSQLLAREINRLTVHTVIKFSGWYPIKTDTWHYWSGLDATCESTRNLVNLTCISMTDQYAADQFALSVLDWGDPQVMVPVFLHSFSGILYKLFHAAGCPIQYILDLCGPTGVGKTLLMRLLFCPFDPERRMANFTSTAKGIELFCEQNLDSVAVVDDLSSMQDTKSKELLERLLRQYCDGNGRLYSTNGGKELGTTSVIPRS